MEKLKVLILIVSLMIFVGCGVPVVEYSFNANWSLLTVVGIDYTSSERVYILNNGVGTCTEHGSVMGNGFTYSNNNITITIVGGAEEGLFDNTYTYSVSGNILTLTFEITEMYTFEK